MRAARWRYTLGGVGVAALLTATACSGSKSSSASSTTRAAAPPGNTKVLPLQNTSSPPVAVKVPDQPIASAPASVANVQLEVYVLKRSGANMVTLVGALYNTGTSKVQIGTQLGEDKIAGYNVGAVSLVDGVNLKQYLTFRTGNDSAISTGCLCSRTDDAFANGILAGQRWVVVLVANLGLSAAHGQAPTPTPAPNIVNLQPRVIDLQPRVIDIAPKVSQQGGQTQLSVESDVLFAFDSANLGPDAQPVLAQVIAKLRTAPAGTVLIVGYTDSIGDDNYNLDLSRRRASAVQAYLQAQVARSELTYQTDGKGRADPAAPNTRPDGGDNPDGRRLNRRVTITYAG